MRINNMREVAQLLCQGEPPETEVTITLGTLQKMRDAAQVTVLDQLACAYAIRGFSTSQIYGLAHAALNERASYVL